MDKKSQIHRAVKKLQKDNRLRAEVMLYFSLAVNLAYAVLQGVTGVAARSIWAGTLAFYYLILSTIRFSLLLGHQKTNIVQKWKKYRNSAFTMLILNFALLGIHCITLYMGHVITYPGYMIYAMAVYTFYMAITAIRNVIIYRKYNDPILSASKALTLAVAAISIYSLQSAMISAFGDSEKFRIIMGNCVGAGVFVLISAISFFMIVKGTKAIRREVLYQQPMFQNHN